MINGWLEDYLKIHVKTLELIPTKEVAVLIELLRKAVESGHQIFVAGNGGSAANASHFTTDLGKGSSDAIGKPFRVLSLNDNTPWMTAIGNDYSYDDVFVRQLMNYGQINDVLLVISVSGNSPNVLKALEWAKQKGMETVALVGGAGGKAAETANHSIVIQDRHYGRVEDCQMTILHMLCYAFMEIPALKPTL